MDTAIKVKGRVEKGRIVTEELPFAEGQEVEISISEPILSRTEIRWASPNEDTSAEAVADRLRRHEMWLAHIGSRTYAFPNLSDEEISRESIYEDRGL